MNQKKIIKTLLLSLLFLGIANSNAKNKTEAFTGNESVALADFLNEISEKHKVFFTYNSDLISEENLNPNEYNYDKLKKIISKLERKTRFDFEYLGNKYYVVYHKKEDKVTLASLNSVQSLGTIAISAVNNFQNTVSGVVKD